MTAGTGGTVVVLFGPPGSGKGTQGHSIADSQDLDYIATGDMLRAEVAAGSPLGREVEPVMRAGALVSDDLMVRVFEARLRQADTRAGVLLDGFPRTVQQARAFDEMLQHTGRRVDLLIVLDVPEEELVARILLRAGDEGRADDTAATVRTRLAVYLSETAPVLAHYRAQGVSIENVDGVGSVAEVRERIGQAFAGMAPGRAAS